MWLDPVVIFIRQRIPTDPRPDILISNTKECTLVGGIPKKSDFFLNNFWSKELNIFTFK